MSGPCRSLAPTIDALAGEFAGKVKVCKLDVDRAGAISNQYSVELLPTLILFQGGREVRRRTGAASRTELSRWIKNSFGIK